LANASGKEHIQELVFLSLFKRLNSL